MTTLQVRNIGSYGFDVTPLDGVGLSSAQASITRSQVADAQKLADAIRQALVQAREAGVLAFNPSDDSLLDLIGLSTTAIRDTLFHEVIGHAYGGGPLTVQDWSRAISKLEHWAGAQASMLPPDAGGGSRMVQGVYYVNGLPWSLSELFTVNRVNTLSEIDRLVADSLNVIAANNAAAKGLTSLMKELMAQYYAMADSDSKTWSDINQAGYKDADYPISYEQLLAYADKYIGSTSMIRQVATPQAAKVYAAWDSTKNYALDDLVTYDGGNWKCIALNTTTAADFDPNYREWTGNYNQYDTVSYAGDLWQSRINFASTTPGKNEEWTIAPLYSATQIYAHKGEVVRFGDHYYKKTTSRNTTGVEPTNTSDWEYHETRTSRSSTPGNGDWLAIPADSVTRNEFRSLVDELQTIIEAFGSDNQVAQLRNETLFNSRSNLLEGLSAFLKGQQTTRSELARNA
ncbi:MAG: hypothetical protein RL322_1315 [Pseudomonadota bacterium]